MASAAKAADYLHDVNWKSFVEWLTAEVILNRPLDPVQYSRDILGAKLSERGVSPFDPSQISEWLRGCYTEATALVDDNGIIHGWIKENSHKSLPEQLDELKHRVAIMDSLIDMSRLVSSSLEHVDVSLNVISSARILMKCDKITLYTIDAESKEIVGNIHDLQNSFRMPFGEGIPGIVSTTGDVVRVTDASIDLRYINSVNLERDKKYGYTTSSILCCPLISSSNQIMGAIEAVNKLDGLLFSKEDEDALKLFSTISANSLKHTIHYKEVDGYRLKSRIILDLVKQLHADMSSNTFPTIISQQASRIVDADRCVLFFLDNMHRTLYQMQGTVSVNVPLEQGIVGHVLTTGQMKNIPNAYDDALFNDTNDKKSGYVTKSILCIPIRASGVQSQIIGALQFTNKLSAATSNTVSTYYHHFTDEDVYLVTSFAALIHPIISGSMVYQQLLKKGQRALIGSQRGALSSLGSLGGASSKNPDVEDEDEEDDDL